MFHLPGYGIGNEMELKIISKHIRYGYIYCDYFDNLSKFIIFFVSKTKE